MSWTLTASGKRFDIDNPKPEQICIEDIAAALSKLCRFNGHCREFYSVAQHSFYVASIVPDEYRLAGLLHDATEAYVGDMVSPLKMLMPAYKEYERHLWGIIAEKFGLPLSLPSQVKHADMVMLATEKRDLMPHHPDRWPCLADVEPHEMAVVPITPRDAEGVFMQFFKSLTA